MKRFMSEQPVVIWGITSGTVIALVTALITLAQVMGWMALTQEQIAAIIAVVSIVASIVFSAVARTSTTPMSNPKLNDGTPLIPETKEIREFLSGALGIANK